MTGSATGFLQTVDYYESVSESFPSELDEMVLLHKYSFQRKNEAEVNSDGMRYQNAYGIPSLRMMQKHPSMCESLR